MEKIEKFEAFNLLEAEVDNENRRVRFWLKDPRFLLGEIPFKDYEDAKYILRNVSSLGTMKKMYEEHKSLL